MAKHLSKPPVASDGTVYNSSVPEYGLGAMYECKFNSRWAKFRYVQFRDAVAYAQGNICFWSDDSATMYQVTVDYSESLGDVLWAVGVVLGTQTQNYYGFVQVAGVGTVLHNNDDDAVAGSELIATAADNGLVNVGTRTLMAGVGTGLAAVSASTNLQSADICIFG